MFAVEAAESAFKSKLMLWKTKHTVACVISFIVGRTYTILIFVLTYRILYLSIANNMSTEVLTSV